MPMQYPVKKNIAVKQIIVVLVVMTVLNNIKILQANVKKLAKIKMTF